MAKGLKSIKITSSGVVTTAGKAGILWGYTLIGGSAGSTKALFKNGGASGTDTWAITAVAGTAVGDVTVEKDFSRGVVFSTDIYCTLTGTGAYIYVSYEELEG